MGGGYEVINNVPFGALIEYEQPNSYIVADTNYSDDYEIPVLTAGQTFILGYTKEDFGIYNANKENPVIIFDDFTTAIKWVDFPFKVKSSAIKILTNKDEKISNFRYLYYVMQSIGYKPSSHERQWISKYTNLVISLPPLEIQNRIVNVLDNFDAICSDLKIGLPAEIEKRQQQYEYYRDKLLTFNNEFATIALTDRQTDRQTGLIRLLQYVYGYVSICLGNIGKISMCKRILKSETNTVKGVPFYKIGTFGGKADAYISEDKFLLYKETYSYPNKGDILISAAGTIGRTVVFDGEPSYFQDSNIVWIANDEKIVLNRYLYYCYQLQPWQISTGGTIARLYNDNIANAVICVPSLEKQKEIINILDKFNIIANDLQNGLPAEIEARQKQYEYYRDKLLTFKEIS